MASVLSRRLPLACGMMWSALLLGCATRRVSVPIMPPLIPAPRPTLFWAEPFDAQLDPARWREIVIRARTQYEAVTLEGRRCLKAESRSAASILVSAMRFDPDTYEWLSWDWRVDRLVEGEALGRKEGSDASARVYVYFETAGLPWQKRSLDYVWSASLPVGTILSSAFSGQSKIIVAESGEASLGRWRQARRNIGDDYRQCFGEDPPPVIAIGVMTDTDNTNGEAVAYFDNLRVTRLEGSAPSEPTPGGQGP